MLRMLPEAWFDSKRQPDGNPFVASRRSGGRRTVVWPTESGRIIAMTVHFRKYTNRGG
jgi:hypothetical protein